MTYISPINNSKITHYSLHKAVSKVDNKFFTKAIVKSNVIQINNTKIRISKRDTLESFVRKLNAKNIQIELRKDKAGKPKLILLNRSQNLVIKDPRGVFNRKLC
jgi:hypothetical protein